ncbi:MULTISPECIES: hypothetical protein [Idiomarinaceae]|uniref:Cytochrome P450 n=1 Tax=Pseudidiomarina fusca TaxID=2965078 RepID=A0ABU3KXV3_9GAMM|nr:MULTISPECIES: hypothetical protein [Idiomarinaceae]MDT7526343.1 cytochrome P450 [Pseudidiomarina sp. GXY010]MRJ42965.1 hypothetical protein [Idiomarina sp. FeN1]NCU58517.1 hypothetical protein [Idiomarina sp. FenA--70]NCU61214.1 hypothetical protein [Idiomarina sp. FenBw--71]UUN12714.1 hypothetical protein KGF88_08605 [Idiomarina loihiensis]
MNKLAEQTMFKRVVDFEEANALLRRDGMQVPGLLAYLEQLQRHNVSGLDELVRFTRLAPFFQEGEQLRQLRDVYKDLLDVILNDWSEYIKDTIEKLVDNLDECAEFDLVEELSLKVFDSLLKPTLGLMPADSASFNADTIRLQELVQPYRSLRELKAINQKIKRAIEAVEDTVAAGIVRERTALGHLLRNRAWPERQVDKISIVIILYAATAPLAQTFTNIVAKRLQESRDRTVALSDEEIAKGAAQSYLHRVCKDSAKDSAYNGTYLFDIQAIERGGCPAFPFGHGRHFCVGFGLSRFILKYMVQQFFTKFPTAKILDIKHNENNKIAYEISRLVIRTT